MTSVVGFLRRRSGGGGGTTVRRCSKSRRSLMSMRYRGRPDSRVARFTARSSPERIQVRTLSMLGKEINASHRETHRKLVKGQNPFVPETDESSQSPEDGQSRKSMMEK